MPRSYLSLSKAVTKSYPTPEICLSYNALENSIVPSWRPTIWYVSENVSLSTAIFSNTAQPPCANSLILIRSPTSKLIVGSSTIVVISLTILDVGPYPCFHQSTRFQKRAVSKLWVRLLKNTLLWSSHA